MALVNRLLVSADGKDQKGTHQPIKKRKTGKWPFRFDHQLSLIPVQAWKLKDYQG